MTGDLNKRKGPILSVSIRELVVEITVKLLHFVFGKEKEKDLERPQTRERLKCNIHLCSKVH